MYPYGKWLDRLRSLFLVRQPVKEKKNTEL